MGGLCFFLGVCYSIYNGIYQVHQSHFVYILLQIIGIFTMGANRFGRFDLAKIILLSGANLIVYLLAAKGHFETDTQYIFLFLSLCSYGLFGFEKKVKAWTFTFVPVFLFLFGLYSEYSPLTTVHYPPQYLRFNQGVNFLITSICSIGMLYVLSRITFESETELRRNQEKISLQNETLTKVNQELDQFVYSTSHGLRSPLRSVLGLITIARRSPSPEELNQCLKMMEGRIEKLDELLKKIADYSKNATLSIEIKTFYLKKELNLILQEVSLAYANKSINVILDIQDNLTLSTDKVRLHIILQNLITNAFDHHDNSRENPFVKISATITGSDLTVSITDNGKGIHDDLQPFIFDMFYRASEESTGSGLGLYIAKESVEKMNGKISFHSAISMGSVFEINLPGVITSVL